MTYSEKSKQRIALINKLLQEEVKKNCVRKYFKIHKKQTGCNLVIKKKE